MKRRNTTVLSLLLIVQFLFIYPLFAQKIDVRVDGKRIFDRIAYMASDQFLGRKPNTPEFYKLQEWVIDQYESWGLEPAGENETYFQSVPVNREYAFSYGTPKLVINDREFFSRYDDFEIDTKSATGKKFKGNIVFAGYGICAPDSGLDEYAGIDVKGKIVLVLKGNPGDFDPPRSWFSQRDTAKDISWDAWEQETADSTKIQTAHDKGAAGIIFYNPDEEDRSSRRRRQELEVSPFKRDFIIVSEISERVFQWILWTDQQMTSRAFNTWLNKIRTDIKNQQVRSFDTKLKAEITGFEKTLFKGEKFGDNNGRNIIAKITGTDPELKNQYVVIGAHFDHVGMTNGQIYNGADDNASGSAVVIEIARLMKKQDIQTKRSVVFCLWTAEELGLIGSRYWVKNPTDNITMDQVVSYFNMDMVSLGDKINAPGALNFPSIWEVIKRDQDEDILDAVDAREGGPGGSDHSAFIELGIEALALMTHGSGGHPDYHDTGDDVEKLNPEILRKTGQFVLQGIVNLGNEMGTQLLIANRQDIFDALRWDVVVMNPNLDVEGNWSVLEFENTVALTDSMLQKIKEMKQPEENDGNARRRMWRRYYRRAYRTGINGAEIVNHDINLLQITKEIFEFGRIDFEGDDGIWFDDGLTAEGKNALKAMEKQHIIPHFINPDKETLEDVLNSVKESFLISGFTALDDSLIARMNEKDVLIGVDFHPDSIDKCVDQLELLKAKFDDTDNLLLNVVSEDNLEDAKKELYHQLIEKGWEKKEIYAIGGDGTSRRSEGNLDQLPRERPQFPPRR